MADKKLAIKLGLVKEYWDELSRYSIQAYHRDNARYGRETTQRDDDWEKYNDDYNKAQSICKKIAATIQSKLPSGITFLMLVRLFNRVKKGELELPKDEPNSEESDNGLGLTPEEEDEYDRLDNMGQFTPDEIIKKIRSGQTEGVDTMRLDEASRNELISKTRIDNRDRYNKRLGYRPVTFDGVNIKELFDNGELVFTTKVGDYTNIIAVKGVLDAIKSAVKGKGKTTYADVLKAINSCLDKDGIRMDCTCADWQYRYRYWSYKGGYLYGDPGKSVEPPKYKRTNMDGRGSMCKHLASTLSRKEWIVKVAAAINNYIRLHKEECYPYLDLEVPHKKVDNKVGPEDEAPIDTPIDGEETPVEEPTDQVGEEPIDDSSDEFNDDDVGEIVSDDEEDEDNV